MEGLCAVGAFDSLGNPDPTKPVKNLSISRLHLTGFSDGVLGLNTNGLTVTGVRSDHNTGYGIARFVSTPQTSAGTGSPSTTRPASPWATPRTPPA